MKKTTFTESFVSNRKKSLQSLKRVAIAIYFSVFSMVIGTHEADAQCSMACSNANIGIAQNCTAFVSPLSVARINLGCSPTTWIIYIRETMNGPIIASGTIANPAQVNGFQYLNRTLVAEVLDEASGNRCWAFIVIEDKSAPRITCDDVTLECDEMLDYEPEVEDNCLVVETRLIGETRRNGSCDPNSQERIDGITTVITRTYVAIDHVGLRDTCTVRISVRRPDISLVECPDEEVQLLCSGNWEKDNRGRPHPSVTGYPTYNGVELNPAAAALYCNLMVGYDDIELPGICLGERKIMRTWRVSEWYCGQDLDRVCMQVIILRDTLAPTITCPAPSTVNTGFYTCASVLQINRPAVTDNCSPSNAIVVDLMFRDTFIHNFQGGLIRGFQVGENVITFIAYDNCLNSTSCTQVITVEDRVVPIAICRTFTTASLGTDGTAQVPWQSIDDGSYDNCGIDRIEIKRKEPHPCDPQPEWGPFISVCCEDTPAPVSVVLRVFDTSGNSNTCCVELEVQDKLPAQIQCPPNVTVQCGFDLSDLTVFGTVANLTKGEPRNPIIINGNNIGQDGFAFDNCQVMIFREENINLTVCGAGTVTRTFRAVGAGNATVASCNQIITVENNVNYLPQSIVWPCDIVLTNFCTDNPSVDLTPAILATISLNQVTITQCPGRSVTTNPFFDRPRYTDDECTQVGLSFKDHVFEIQDSACYKILREWKIIDWCAMEQNPGSPITEFIYHHTQVIKIKNTIGPEITCGDGPLETCSFQTNCSTGEVLTVSAIASDDCTRPQDLFWRWEYFQNNGNTVTQSGNSNTLTRNFPVGTHRVRFLVEDQCGNTAACTQLVIVRDCKQPTPICHHLVIDLMITGMVNIEARLFNAGSYDNCTPQADLRYRIERAPFTTPGSSPPASAGTSATFTCDDLGLNDVRIWVGDDDGNWDFCVTTLLVQNNIGANCFGSGGGIIAGRLRTENHENVEKAEVRAEGGFTGAYTTGNEGMFEFRDITRGSSFSIKPRRSDNPVNGVTTLDILKIQRHILGLEELDSPYKIIAADVNRSTEVTGADLVEIRRLILNVIDEFSNAPSWRFVPKDYVFHDPQNPLRESFPEQLQVLNFQGNIPVVDFVAIKVGDVNESVRANSTNLHSAAGRSNGAIVFEIENREVKKGDLYEVNFTSQDFKNIMGYQFTFNFNPADMRLEDIKPGVLSVSNENFGFNYLKEGLLTTSWNSTTGVSAAADDVLFTLVFRALNDTNLSESFQITSALTHAEAYNDLSGETLDVQLSYKGGHSAPTSHAFELFQNRPNPFNNNTIISFNLPESQSATLTVYDLTGKVIYAVNGEYAKGYNELTLEASALQGATGVLYYELRTDSATAVKKMVRVQ